MKKTIFDLSEKVALITAGGHGLGREFCEAMAEFGAKVVCNDISSELAQETVEGIKSYGHEAIVIQADVSKKDEIERMVDQAVAKFGKIDILFCNAGIVNPIVPLHELAIEDWDRVIAVNVTGIFLCMRSVLPLMLKQKSGSIIITSSVAGLMAGSEAHSLPTPPYGTSKAALIGLTRHAAASYAKYGIRVNSIAPGAHSTRPVGKKRNYEEVESFLSRFIPMGRVGKPSEIRGLAVYLASDASSYVTGQVFVHDGGFTA